MGGLLAWNVVTMSPLAVLQEMLQAGLIIAGWDPVEGGSVYAVPLGGTLIKCPFAIGETAAAAAAATATTLALLH